MYAKAPVGLVIFFLRHRQACQKLRKNITSPTGLVFVLQAIEETIQEA